MGASRWIYFTDKNTDPQAALDELREQVFQQTWRPREPSCQTLADLLESGIIEEEGGTHSIIDVDRVIVTDDVDAEEDGTVRLITRQETIEFFGTDTPTRGGIERVHTTSAADLPPMFRGSGCCTPVYDEHGSTAGLAFWGITGD